MTMHTKVSGVWKDMNEAHTKVAGSWKTITEGYENVGGVWKQFFASGEVTVTGASISSSQDSGPVVARLIINQDGTVDKRENGVTSQINSSTDWIIPNSAASSSYEVRFTNLLGTVGGGTTLTEDVWAPIDQDHIVEARRTGAQGNGQSSATFDLEIRLGSSGAALDSGNFTLEAELF